MSDFEGCVKCTYFMEINVNGQRACCVSNLRQSRDDYVNVRDINL